MRKILHFDSPREKYHCGQSKSQVERPRILPERIVGLTGQSFEEGDF